MKIRRILWVALVLMLVCHPSEAQVTKKDTGNGPLKERVGNFWKKTKKSIDKVADKVSNDLSSESSGLRRVKGKYYMNIYDTNIYKGEDCDELRGMCQKEFAAKYPAVKIHYCVIPQTDWETETIESNGVVTGYSQSLFCYILGKDGEEGFINAKFVFERQKKVGEASMSTHVKWPLWLRTDVLTNEVTEQLMMK